MRRKEYFSEYDNEKIEKAKKLLSEVYEYYYGDTATRKQWKRLETIIKKTEELQELNTEPGGISRQIRRIRK